VGTKAIPAGYGPIRYAACPARRAKEGDPLRRWLLVLAVLGCATGLDEFGRLSADPAGYYEEDSFRFFETFAEQARHVESCADVDQVERFLSISPQIAGNAEIAEAFAEVLEKLVLRDPKCFLSATEDAPDRLAESLATRLSAPLFNPDVDLSAHLLRARDVELDHPVVECLRR